jgi:hypothetical protein
MRIQALLFIAATLSTSAAAFAAPPKASTAYRPSADEARYMRGTYALSDGRILRITSQRSRVYAEIDGRAEELVPVGERTFVTSGSEERLVFDQLPFPTELTFETAPQRQVLAAHDGSQPSDLPKRPAW